MRIGIDNDNEAEEDFSDGVSQPSNVKCETPVHQRRQQPPHNPFGPSLWQDDENRKGGGTGFGNAPCSGM